MLVPYLFSTDQALVAALTATRPDLVGGVIVDWENRGKRERQAGARGRIGIDTQINANGPNDLASVVEISRVPVLCRLNRWTDDSIEELESAIRLGASEVLLPMVRTTGEVAAAVDAAAGRVGVGILIETDEAVQIAARLAAMPITRAYLGLMDLALDRGSGSIFDALADGTVQHVRSSFGVPFGFAGLTVPGGGSPVPVRLLAAEMVRLGCAFSFLRRSFVHDSVKAPVPGVTAIRRMVRDLESRDRWSVERDRLALKAVLETLSRVEGAVPADQVGSSSSR